MPPALIDTDSLSEVLKGRDPTVRAHGLAYLAANGRFTFSIIANSADIYGDLYRRGQLVSDADIFIAGTALQHGLELVTENVAHFGAHPGFDHAKLASPVGTLRNSFPICRLL